MPDEPAEFTPELVATMSDAELLTELGAALVGDDPAAAKSKHSAADLSGRAENFLARRRDDLRDAVCPHHQSIDGYETGAAQVAAVFDYVVTVVTGVPSCLFIAGIILHRGLDWLCSGYDSASA